MVGNAIGERLDTAGMRELGAARLAGFTQGSLDERPPLVFLHGLTFDHRMWLPTIRALEARDPGRQLLVVDLPGHGGSPMLPSSSVDDVAAAVASAVEDARFDRPVVVGHSIAAVIAAVYAARFPTRGVVDVDQELDSSFVGILQANRAAITGPGFAQVWPGILASMRIDLVPPDRRSLLSTELPRQDLVLAYWREAMESSIPSLDARIDAEMAAARRRGLPFLIVAGHPYGAAYVAWLRERLPQATVRVVPNSGHFPHLAEPDLFASLLAATAHWRLAPEEIAE